MRKLYILTAVFASLVLNSSDQRISGKITFSPGNSGFFNIDKKKLANGKTGYFVSDLSYSKEAMSGDSDIIISFNTPKPELDDTRKYRLKSSSYNFVSGKGSLGGGAAFFFRKQDRVIIAPSKGLWLTNTDDLGSFSIEFRINPASAKNGIIFSRTGLNTGLKNGIEIRYENGRIVSCFFKIFENSKGQRFDAVLSKCPVLSPGKWHHYFLSFDRITGKLSHLINENEYESVFITENGSPSSDVLKPSFLAGDAPSAKIGQGFSGMLDEFRINYTAYDEASSRTDIASRSYREVKLMGREPVNREGIISSAIHAFPATGTMIRSFSCDGSAPAGTDIRCEIRMSDKLFEENDTEPKWYRVNNDQRSIYLTKTPEGFLRGRYFQWRAKLIAAPEGTESPVFRGAEIEYEIDGPPARPLFAEIVDYGDKYIIIRWKKNVDRDIAGYNIYYGVKKGEYDGIIRYAGGKRISNFSNSAYVTVKIDNNLVEENRGRYVRGMIDYPEIKNNVLYYFSITAYDSYKVDTEYNHESEKSSEISARPAAPSEITR